MTYCDEVPLSIILPTLNEAQGIGATLDALQPLRKRGCELIAVDGGSADSTTKRCKSKADLVIEAPRGRASQLNAGVAQARGGTLLFVHADTLLPPDADRLVVSALSGGAEWGRFDVRIVGKSRMLPLVAALMNLRSRWTGIATGDQAIFVQRSVFQAVGGFPEQPLMEDIELSRRLRSRSRPACLHQSVLTSGRRWDENGMWRTILLMWWLRWSYWRGVSPEHLARLYR